MIERKIPMPVTISIIVPVYNAEAFLTRCVESILGQSLTSLELILVDDGSTDQSPALCDAFAAKDTRIRVLHTQNAGPSAARNAGLSAATGDYIGFADADDRADPELFATLYARAEKADADLSICDYWMDTPDGASPCKIFPGENRAFSAEEIRSRILPYFFGYAPDELRRFADCCPFADSRSYVWICLYRAEMIRENALRFPDEKLYYTEDNLFNLSAVFHAKSAVYTARPLYHYQINTATFTARFQPAYLDCRLRKYAYLKSFAEQNDLAAEASVRLPRKICAETPTLLNYYAANAPAFSKKFHFVSKILRTPVVAQALSAVPSAEWPGGRLGVTLTLAKRKQAVPIVLACLLQKRLRALKAAR